MENEAQNLNTESNDIAGNRIDGPVGNTAARPGAPGHGTGIPGGPPVAGTPAPTSAAAPAAAEAAASSESLAASETSVGKGTVGDAGAGQENKPANPADLESNETYGGNFSNSTQDSYHDQDRRDNQDSDPNRGEFGVHSQAGTTHGGFGNQNRRADYEPNGTAEDRYYGGAGRPGPQDNAYRAYDGRDERADPNADYGFEAGAAPGNTSGQAAEAAPTGPGTLSGPRTDNTSQPGRADEASAFQNDNGSPIGPDRGYAADYGHTSLPGVPTEVPAAAGDVRRNQSEDGQSSRGGYDNQGTAGGRVGHAQEEQGDADRDGEQPRPAPDYQTGDSRNGYGQSFGGSEKQGAGTRGGSYNDTYDDSKPNSQTGLPTPGAQRQEDLDANYGEAARQQNRTSEDNSDDHGAPRRNAGRAGEADE